MAKSNINFILAATRMVLLVMTALALTLMTKTEQSLGLHFNSIQNVDESFMVDMALILGDQNQRLPQDDARSNPNAGHLFIRDHSPTPQLELDRSTAEGLLCYHVHDTVVKYYCKNGKTSYSVRGVCRMASIILNKERGTCYNKVKLMKSKRAGAIKALCHAIEKHDPLGYCKPIVADKYTFTTEEQHRFLCAAFRQDREIDALCKHDPQPMVNQEAMGMMKPQAMGMMKPQAMEMMKPQAMGMMKPQAMEMMKPQAMAMMKPQAMEIMKPQAMGTMGPPAMGMMGLPAMGMMGPPAMGMMEPPPMISRPPAAMSPARRPCPAKKPARCRSSA